MRVLIILFLMTSACFVRGQVTRVESTHSVKATFLGVSYAYEQWLTQKATVNFDLMLAGGFGTHHIYGDYWALGPIVQLETRCYYNFLKRHSKGRNTAHNSANYLSLSLDYQPGVSFGNNARELRTLSIIPKWGLRRTFAKNFIFEFATGIGVYQSEIEPWQPAFGIDLKFGYAFSKQGKGRTDAKAGLDP